MTDMYTCSICGYVGKRRPEKEALNELKLEFGDVNVKDCAVVCDECWEKVKPSNSKKIFEIGEEQNA